MWQRDFVKHWQHYWVLIKQTDLQTDLDIESSSVTVSINRGCGTELNRTALGEFAEYIKLQWSAIYGTSTTCPGCGE